MLAAEAVRLQRLFDDAALPVLFLKGASLAVLAFGGLGLRCAKDIDILVSQETLPTAVALLERAGYGRFDPPRDTAEETMRLLMPLRKDLGLIHQTSGIRVELHWRLFLNPHAMTSDSIMAASRTVPIAGTAELRTLGQEDLFAYLCMHGALHWWNQLKWLADIGALLAAMPEGSAEKLNRAAGLRGAGRASAQALLLCRRLLKTRLSMQFVRELSQTPNVRWLEKTSISALTIGHGEKDRHEVRFGTTRGSLSAFFLGDSWRYRRAELGNIFRNQSDILTVPLPKGFRFLYPLLRLPLWVWRQSTLVAQPRAKRFRF